MMSKFMKRAVCMASEASAAGEIPVGAVIVRDGEIIAEARNDREHSHDATGHAEVLVIRHACERLGTWRLDDCELYVTLEPCPMCMGSAINSRMKRIIYGAKDPKAGACGSVINLNSYPFNHKPELVFEELCGEDKNILSDFFKNKR